MSDYNEPGSEKNVPKDRRTSLSRLRGCDASLPPVRRLDLETVLREVVESARTLTGARYGAITTIDETGAPKDFVTSGPAYIPMPPLHLTLMACAGLMLLDSLNRLGMMTP